MSSLTRDTRPRLGATPEQHRDAAIGMLHAHREARARLETAEHHVIVAAWNAGLSENQIAGELELSRTPVKRHLLEADARGELHRRRFPASTGRPPRAAVA